MGKRLTAWGPKPSLVTKCLTTPLLPSHHIAVFVEQKMSHLTLDLWCGLDTLSPIEIAYVSQRQNWFLSIVFSYHHPPSSLGGSFWTGNILIAYGIKCRIACFQDTNDKYTVIDTAEFWKKICFLDDCFIYSEWILFLHIKYDLPFI